MKSSQIKTGETYLFVATESVARKHLEGQPFEVVEIKRVWRRGWVGRLKKLQRFFNADGVGARAEELEPLPERESPCKDCATGEMKQEGLTQPNGTQKYVCDNCGTEERFP